MREHAPDRRVERFFLDDVVDQADAESLRHVELLAGEHVAMRVALADRGDHVGTDHGRDDAELHFRQPESGVARGDGDVAGGDQPDAAAAHRAAHAGNGRFPELVERIKHAGSLLCGFEVLLRRECRTFLHVLNVRSGAEALAGADDHDSAHFGIGLELFQRRGERLDHLGVERVMHFRTVEHHRCVAVPVDLRDNLFAHAFPSARPPGSCVTAAGACVQCASISAPCGARSRPRLAL